MKTLTGLLLGAVLMLAGCRAQLDAMQEQRAIQDAVNHCYSERELWMQGSVNINATDIVVSGHCIPIQARESMEAAAAGLKDATTAEFPDYTLIATHDRRTQYYFTKPSHRLYPWAIATFVAGKYAAPGATNDNPVGVRGTLALPKALSAPATSADAQTVLNWANSRLDALRAEFRIAPPATTTTPLKSSADPAKPSIPS